MSSGAGDVSRGLSACQRGGPDYPAVRWPWRGDCRADEKTRLFKYVRSATDGVPLSKVVRDVFGNGAVETAGADYQLARRFFGQSSCFRIARRDGILWVEPTFEAFNLSPQYATGKTAGRDGGGLSNDESGPTARCSDDMADCQAAGKAVDSRAYPKDRAQAVLDKRTVLDGSDDRHDYRVELLRELGVERELQQDKFKILRRVRGTGSEYLLLPYRTRFNDEGRAQSVRDGFETALQQAADRHGDAVMLSLSTDAKRHDSTSAALENLYEAKSRFMSWLATDYQLGYRPENLTVLEWTQSGLPHVHVVLFGVSWALPQSQLAAKWDDLGQGRVVDIRQVVRDRRDNWVLHNDGGDKVTLQQYLGKAIRELCRVAEMDTGDLVDCVESGDVHLWRQALYWATERQYFSCSPSLKVTEDGGLPHVKRYEFVGVSQYRDIPAHVRQDAVLVDRPPPSQVSVG